MSRHLSEEPSSPLVGILGRLRQRNPSWQVDIGRPDEDGWISGADLRSASSGPFNDLLVRIGERARTSDKRTIAASFALRFGWTSVMAIGPYLDAACVPDVTLENIAVKFKASTFFERMAMYEARGAMIGGEPGSAHPLVTTVSDRSALTARLRDVLVAQAGPVVDALHAWSGFAPRGTWGMLTSSWAGQFTAIAGASGEQRDALPLLRDLFAGDDVVGEMRPRLHLVTCESVTQVFQRRASCCRYYLLPHGELCTSCPLVSHDERIERNTAWMRKQLDGAREKRGHS